MLFDEIKNIQSRSLRKTVEAILLAADEEFWIVPCSGTGKHHPAEDQGEAGLIRHLVKAVYVGGQEARRKRFSDYEYDATIAAIIIHDIKKNGDPWGSSTDFKHGILGADFIKKFYFKDKTLKKIITDAVRYHMAPWNTTIDNERLYKVFSNNQEKMFSGEEMNKEIEERIRGCFPTRVEKAVQDADYWASREGMSFFPSLSVMPDMNKEKDLRKHDSPEEWAQEILGFNDLMQLYKDPSRGEK